MVVLTNNGKNIPLGLNEYTKWLCLIEAMEYIEARAAKTKFNLDNNNDWIKPLALQKYVKERFLSMRHDVICNLRDQ